MHARTAGGRDGDEVFLPFRALKMTTCDVQSRGNGDSAQQHLEKQLLSLNSASRTLRTAIDELFPAVSEIYAVTENRSGQISVTVRKASAGSLGGRKAEFSLATRGGHGLAFCITVDGRYMETPLL